MKFVCGLLLLITVQHSSCQESNADQFIAHVQQYCASQQGDNTSRVPSRVGKAGPRGPSGPKGEPGEVDYSVVNRRITSLVEVRVRKAGPRGPPGPKGELGEVDYRVVNRNINSVSEELRALENEVTMIRELMQWFKASNGHYYKLFSSGKSWQQAKAACESTGSILVSAGMRDSTVRLELKKYANLRGIWIGVSDIRQEGTWIWEDGVGSRGNDIGWYPGEPNNAGEGEDCAYLSLNNSNLWKALDASCSDILAYLCEKSPQ